MPETDFNLRTEVNSFTNALIIDDVGEISTLLADLLLERGCSVYYFGKETRNAFSYLEGKENFRYLNTLAEIDDVNKFSYIFYFADKDFLKSGKYPFFKNFQNGKVLLYISYSSFNTEVEDFVKNSTLNLRLVSYTDLFGPRILSGELGKLFSTASQNKEIIIESSSEDKIYPVFSERAGKELIRLTFSPDTNGKMFLIKGYSIAVSIFIGYLTNNFPNVKYNYSEKRKEEDIYPAVFEEIILGENLEEEIEKTAEWFQRNYQPKNNEKEEPKQPTEEEKATKEDKVEKVDFLFSEVKDEKVKVPSVFKKHPLFRKIFIGSGIFLALFFCFFILPLIGAGIFGIIGVQNLDQSRKSFNNNEISQAINRAENAQKYFVVSQKILSPFEPFYGLIGFDSQMKSLDQVWSLSQYANNALVSVLLVSGEAEKISKSFLGGENSDWTTLMGAIKGNLSYAYEQASLAQSFLDQAEEGFDLLGQKETYTKIKEYLPEGRKILIKAQKVVSVLPKIFGIGERKTYLVLFQNNMEIRPTGGFIGSYGIVNLENGKLTSFEVFDVYQADGQLKGHVEPPAKLKQYLGEANWFLRDANWDPNFPISAKRAAWFLDKEMQISTDGTIAVNLEVVKNLLNAIGEVEVPDYKEKINAENLFEKAEYYSEAGTFPGSTQKKDFLGSLAKAIFEKTKNANEKQVASILEALYKSLEEKEILAYFNDEEVQLVISEQNWDGSIKSYLGDSEQKSVFVDYLFLNEANVGIDKANYFVKRDLNQKITLDENGSVKEKLQIEYENQSPSESWPAGRYRNYLRIYLPKGVSITSVLASDPQDLNLWLPFDSKLMDVYEENEKTVLELLVEVPIKSTKKIEVSYDLQRNLNFEKKVSSYLLMVQKQSGAYPSNLTINFSFPRGLIPVRVIPSAVVGDQQLLINQKLNKDLIFQIDLAR